MENKIYVYNISDERVLLSENAEEKSQIASLTKIMTVFVFLENNKLNLEENITITEEMIQGLEGYVVAGLLTQEKISIEDLLYLTMLPSAADAAKALAITSEGSIEKFVEKMNKKAQEIGLENTHFQNVYGEDNEENYSTAKEVSRLTSEAIKNKTFKKIFETFKKRLSSKDITIQKTFEKTPNIIGGKTGFTYEAGRCLISEGKVNDATLLVTILGEDINSNNHIENSEKLYDYFKQNYSYQKILGTGDLLTTIFVKDSGTKEIIFSSDRDVEKFLENNFDTTKLNFEYRGVNEISKSSEIHAGDKLGEYNIFFGDETLYSKELFLESEIEFYPYWLWNLIVAVVFGSIIGIIFFKWRKNHCKSRRGRL